MQKPKLPKSVKPEKTPSLRWLKFKQWLSKHRVSVAIVIGAIIITGAFCFAILSINSSSNITLFSLKSKKVEKFYSPLTGIEVADESVTKAPVTGVMIENSPDARPQSGLKKAGVVYEAVAEGGITRFMALYQNDKPALIGPVRSLRLYYLNWAAPYQASIAHVGGSGNALSEVRNGSYRDIDQFYNADTYWRASDRYAPHNVYTSGEKLDQLNDSKDYKESTFKSFDRTDSKASTEPNATQVSIAFSSDLYSTSYSYDATSNTYARNLAGAPHADREEGQISPTVVVAIEVASELRPGNDGYEDIVTTGSGKAYIFQGGTVTQATWQKDDQKSQLQLKDADGKSVKLFRGQTWVAAFTPGRGSISWQ